jgi:CheY-like chemotaxis protein
MAESIERSILIVEDDETCRHTARDILHGAGFTVFCASDCLEALDFVETSAKIDIALVDVVMPLGTPHGVSFARMAHRRRPRLKVIFMSARVNPSDSLLFDEDSLLLRKPFAPHQLLDFVTRHGVGSLEI